MRIDRLATLRAYDSLYVSPHEADVALSCGSRLRGERAGGRRVLVAVVFAPADGDSEGGRGEIAEAMRHLDVDHVLLDRPAAPERRAEHEALSSRVHGRFPEDEAGLRDLIAVLDELRGRVKPRQLYLPLGVGAEIDHRLCQEAGLNALSAQAGQSVFLYEERPHVFVAGAVRIRLGQLGASLPPGAADIRDRSGVLRFLLRLSASPPVWRGLNGLRERLRFSAMAAREWRQARSWRPQKGLGLRLQPVLHEGPDADREASGEVAAAYRSGMRGFVGSPARFVTSAAEYTRRLGGSGHLERYWLVLPPRERDGLPILSTSAEVAAG